jgi:MYXO-CTERM domain-containing protein
MNDRIRACSPLVALAIASVVALSACEEQSAPEPTQVRPSALTGLQPGDVAVTCVNSTTDEVQIVSLVAIDSGSDLKFSDNEWSGTGWVDLNETTDYAIPVPGAGVTAGEELLFVPGGGAKGTGGISNGPEQLFIYQGSIQPDASSFGFVWGMQISNPAGWGTTADGGTLGNNISALPSALTGANIALVSANPTFWAYTGPMSGTKAQLLAALQTPSNWTGPGANADGGAPNCPGNLTVIPDVVDSGSDLATGTGGSDGGSTGTGGMTGGGDSGTGPDAAVDAGGGTGGMTGNDSGADSLTGTGGSGAGGSTDSGATDAKADTGSATDAKADTGSATDAKADTGKPDTGTATDAKVDTGSKADAGTDAGTTNKGSSGCSCSTASNGANMGAGAWMLALAGIVMTVRRRRR